VSASTHTEIYRRFEGQLRPARPRFVPLWRARVAAAQKSKLALLLLYAPPAISGIVFSFVVYLKFTAEAQMGAPGGLGGVASMAMTMSERLIQVHEQVVHFLRVSRAFALLAIAWYAAGLVCDDRRAGAHLLYFSRPLTRRDYHLAQLATATTFGLRAVLWPASLILLVAVFSSPDYSFLREKGEVIAATFAYALIYVLVMASVVLAISSLSARKMYALGAVFAVVFGSEVIGEVLAQLRHSGDWRLVALGKNFDRLLYWMLEVDASRQGPFGFRGEWSPWISVAILGALALVANLLLAWRLRRMEVVA
jgi:hypothetical protein